MRAEAKLSVFCFALFALPAGCSDLTGVSSLELEQVVARDGVSFAAESIPIGVLDRLAQHKLVVVGETHLIREHQEFMAELVQELHSRGFRQLLLEFPHMADWLLADFVQDWGLEGWQPPTWSFGLLCTAIRDFNRTLPEDQRIQVRGIDVNLSDYGGLNDFLALMRTLSEHLSDPGPIDAFLSAQHHPPEVHEEALTGLRDDLQARRTELIDAWGSYWYDTVAEMVDVELVSVTVRAIREDDYDQSVKTREKEMKRLADVRLAGYAHRTLLNVGGNHAQKERLKGTEQEWLGDYLVHRSAEVGGSSIVLGFVAAKVVLGSAVQYDILDDSPEDEIFRLMYETWPEQIVFMPLDDPIFATSGVKMNFEGQIHRSSPKRHYDVFVQYPLAHRVPLP
jgi:hypothetical protein